MNVDEICAEASVLSRADRNQLVERLLLELGPSDYDVSDREVIQRVNETRNGEVQDLSYQELVSGLEHLK